MSEWRKIETAPKDGRDVLLYSEIWEETLGAVQIASWDRDEGWIFQSALDIDGLDDDVADYGPTHWMPLPPPPAPETE